MLYPAAPNQYGRGQVERTSVELGDGRHLRVERRLRGVRDRSHGLQYRALLVRARERAGPRDGQADGRDGEEDWREMADGIDDRRPEAQRGAQAGPFCRDGVGREEMRRVDRSRAGRSVAVAVGSPHLTRSTQQRMGKGKQSARMRSARRVPIVVFLTEMTVEAIVTALSVASRGSNALRADATIHSEAMIGVCGTQYVPSRRTTFWTRNRRSGIRKRTAMAAAAMTSSSPDSAMITKSWTTMGSDRCVRLPMVPAMAAQRRRGLEHGRPGALRRA